MWDYARIRLRDLLQTPWQPELAVQDHAGTRPATIGDLFTCERSVAMLLRWHVNHPSQLLPITQTSRLSLAFNAAGAAEWGDVNQWTDANEAALCDALFAQRPAYPDVLHCTLDVVYHWPDLATSPSCKKAAEKGDRKQWGWKLDAPSVLNTPRISGLANASGAAGAAFVHDFAVDLRDVISRSSITASSSDQSIVPDRNITVVAGTPPSYRLSATPAERRERHHRHHGERRQRGPRLEGRLLSHRRRPGEQHAAARTHRDDHRPLHAAAQLSPRYLGSAMSTVLAPVVKAMLQAYAPLDRALHDAHAFRVLLRNLGWEREFDDTVLAQPPLSGLASSVAALVEHGWELVASIEVIRDDQDADPLVDALFDVVGPLADVISGLREIDTSELPPGLADPDLWTSLALDVPEYLFVRFLERYHPVLYALLRVVGVIEDDPEPLDPIDPTRPPYVRRLVIWDNLVALVGDPAGQLQSLYHWDDGQPFAHARLLTELAGLAAAMNIRHRHLPPRPKLVDDEYGGELPADDVRELALPVLRASPGGVHTEQGLVLAPVPPKPGRPIDGLYLGNLSFGAAVTSAPLSETWTLVLTGQLAATGLVGVRIRPGETRVLAAPPDGRFEIAAEGRPDPPWLLLGAGAGTRLEVGGLRLSLALEWTDETDVTLGLATLPSADRGGLALTIDPAEADPFARAIVPQPLQADADLDVRWSARGGLVLSELGLELVIPIDRTVGPVTLEVLHLAFVVDAGKASLLLALTGGAAVGPFSAEVADIGVELELVPRADHPLVGDLGVTAAFHPPTGGGLGLDLDGLVTAAGYYNRDPATERYGRRGRDRVPARRPVGDRRDRYATAAEPRRLRAVRERLCDVPGAAARVRLLPFGSRRRRQPQPHDGHPGSRRRAAERRGRRDPVPRRPRGRRAVADLPA